LAEGGKRKALEEMFENVHVVERPEVLMTMRGNMKGEMREKEGWEVRKRSSLDHTGTYLHVSLSGSFPAIITPPPLIHSLSLPMFLAYFTFPSLLPPSWCAS